MPDGRRKRILVVEDHDDTRLLYRIFLESSGFDITEAVDGEQAVSKALANPPDVVVLDIGLPKLDGFEVARRLRRFPQTASIPIIAISAQGIPGYEKVASIAGCNEALSKPCLPSDLLKAVRRVLGGSP